MTVSPCCSSPVDIKTVLADNLDPKRRADVEHQLEQCASCRSAIENALGSDEWWDHLRTSLSGGDEQTELAEAAWESEVPVASTQQVMGLLGPSDDPEMLGRIGGYEVVGLLGQGGMGAVFKAFDRPLNRFVAIKLMLPHLAASAAARKRFAREGQAIAAVVDDHVMAIHAVDEWQGIPYLVMTYSRGASLQKRLDQEGTLELREILRIGLQTARGLAAAHAQGIVHRDVKPANVFLDEHVERVQLMDFGLARAADDASLTRSGMLAGTPQFMSPEQARGEPVDPRSDLFSLGSILYMACTGRPAFRAESAYGILRRITDSDPRPIPELNPEIPDWLNRIIERLMAKHAADRFQTAEEVAELLERCLAHLQQPTQVELPQTLTQNNQRRSPAVGGDRRELKRTSQTQPKAFRIRRTGAWIMGSVLILIAAGFGGLQLTAPADISGQWSGENWSAVSLNSAVEADGWYSGSFTQTDGRKGVLQLEWSRLHRRYTGRWRVGGDLSGSITLRSDGSQLRGAVAVDSDSAIPEGDVRLRDFTWQRNGNEIGEQNTVAAERGGVRPFRIESPVKGRVRLGEGIEENAVVKKGDLIAEITLGPELRDRQQAQFAAATMAVEKAELALRSKQQSYEAASESLEIFDTQVRAYEQAKAEMVAAAKANVSAAQRVVESESEGLESRRKAQEQVKQEVDGQIKKLEERQAAQELIDIQKRKQAKANVAVQEAIADLNSSRTHLAQAVQKVDAVKLDAQTKIDEARLRQIQARKDLLAAESDVEAAKLELTQASKDLKKAETELAQQQVQTLIAPVDGIIRNLSVQPNVEEGELVCEILPKRETVTSGSTSQAPSKVNAPNPATHARSQTDAKPEADRRSQRWFTVPVLSIEETLNLTESIRDTAALLQSAKSRRTEIQKQFDDGKQKLKELKEELSQLDGDAEKVDLHLAIEDLQNSTRSRPREIERTESSITDLEAQLEESTAQRQTVIEMLKSRLESAGTKLTADKDLLQRIQLQSAAGTVPPQDVQSMETIVKQSEAEIRELELFLKFHAEQDNLIASIDKEADKSPIETNEKAGVEFVVELLKLRRDAATEKLKLDRYTLKNVEASFSSGNRPLKEVVDARQTVSESEAAVRELDIQLSYWSRRKSPED